MPGPERPSLLRRGLAFLLRDGLRGAWTRLNARRQSPSRGARIQCAAFEGVSNGIRVETPRGDQIYIFVFLGEFGYELLNWQGVVRNFARNRPAGAQIAIAGRAGLQPLYRDADHYIDISRFEPFRESVAAAYFAMPPEFRRRNVPPSSQERAFDADLRARIQAHVLEQLDTGGQTPRFVFSSSLEIFPGCVFGGDPVFYGLRGFPGKIYDDLDFLAHNNRYEKVQPDPAARAALEAKLGFSLEEPYILVQSRARRIGPQTGTGLDIEAAVQRLSRIGRVVQLSFDTGRVSDSRSSFQEGGGEIVTVRATSFSEQGNLIAHARRCVFFTEGDLGSHTYLPPLMGRDVHVIAAREVFAMASAPIAAWNRYVFTSGGQMIAQPYEDMMAQDETWLRERLG